MPEHQKKLFPGTFLISSIIDSAESKGLMARRATRVYTMRALMAGFIIGLFYLANFSIISALKDFSPLAVGIGRLIGAVVFGFALVFIYFTRSELLTANMMITTVAVYYKRMNIRNASFLMLLCFIGNMLGGVVIGLLIAGSTILNGQPGDLVTQATETKLAYVTSGSMPMLDLFIRAIFCNFLINLSMLLLLNGTVTSDGVKVIAMVVAVMLFAFLGFEHSVANTVLFIVVGMRSGIDVVAALGNVAIALIGNFMGGGLLIGWYYSYANDHKRHTKKNTSASE